MEEELNNYFASSHQIRNSLISMRARLSHTVIATFEDASTLLELEMHNLARAREDHRRMQEKRHSVAHCFEVELQGIRFRKIVFDALFAAAAATSSAVAAAFAVVAKANPMMIGVVAVAAAASVLFGAVGKGVHSSTCRNWERPIRKRKEMMSAVIAGGEIVATRLDCVCESICTLRSYTASVLESGEDGMVAATLEELAALQQRFQDVEMKALDCASHVSWAIEAVIHHIVIKNIVR